MYKKKVTKFGNLFSLFLINYKNKKLKKMIFYEKLEKLLFQDKYKLVVMN